MVATQPSGGVPAFLRYPSFNQIFATGSAQPSPLLKSTEFSLELYPRSMQRANSPSAPLQNLLDLNQAGLDGTQGGYLIDKNGRFVFYQIHINPAFFQFLQNQNLTTAAGIRAINVGTDVSPKGTPLQELTFLGNDDDIRTGVNTNIVEYKSAWMIVDPKHVPNNYIVVSARVPHYILKGTTLSQELVNGKPQTDSVKVALLALHVVFTLPGHPEMIWSTFEHVHVTSRGVVRDNAPAASDNPSFLTSSTDTEVSAEDFPLYKAHTARKDANKSVDLKVISGSWDTSSQSFSKGDKIIQTSVYRPFPGSKTDGPAPDHDHAEDSEVIQINDHATAMFKEARAAGLVTADDQRENYRLVGAIWLDQPSSGASPTFLRGKTFTLSEGQSSDDIGQALAGEGRLGSTAMESFTEFEDGAPNCFSCHDTSNVRHSGIVLKPARLNVSHILSKFLISQTPTK